MDRIIVSNKKRIRTNVMDSIRDPYVWVFVMGISALVWTHLHFSVNWSDNREKWIGNTEIIALTANLLFIGAFYSSNSLKTYLMYTAFFEFLATILFLASRDAGNLGAHVTGSSSSLKIEGLINIIALMFLVGFLIANTFVIPFIVLMTLFSFIQTLTILKLKSATWRLMFWIIAQVFILIIIGTILTQLSLAQDEMLGTMWSDYLMKEMHVTQEQISDYGNMIYNVISKFLFLGWFPLFIRLNNLRGTNIFLSFSGLLVIPSVVTFMMINADFIVVHGPLLSLPIFFLSYSALSLFRYFLYFVRASVLNAKECMKEHFIPYVIHKNKRQDIFVEWMVRRQNKKAST